MFRIAHMFRDRGMFAPGGGAPFGVANLQADPNCVLAQLPDYGVWGLQDFPPGTYTETQRYQWAAQKQVPWLRRNILTATEDLSAAAWTKTGLRAFGSGSVADATIAPDGTVSADLIVEDAATSTHRAYQSITTAGGSAVISAYVKPKERAWAYLRMTNPATTSRHCWFNLSGAGSVGTVETDLSGPNISAVGDGWYRISVAMSSIVNGSFAAVIGMATGDAVSSYLGDNASGLYVWGAQLEIGTSAGPYQKVLSSWDATYAALAAAAGFNPGIWQDAGTNPVNTSGQSVYRLADASGKGYTANQATAANRPLWTLDANAKPYLLGDTVNDSLPVTFPASFSSNASVYVTTDAGTTVTDGVTLNGSYAPLVAAKQYARVVFANGRPSYHDWLVKWLNAKAGL